MSNKKENTSSLDKVEATDINIKGSAKNYSSLDKVEATDVVYISKPR